MNKITKQFLLVLIGVLVISSQMLAAALDNNATNLTLDNKTDYFVWARSIQQRSGGLMRNWEMQGLGPMEGKTITLNNWIPDEGAPVTVRLFFGDTPETHAQQIIILKLSPESPEGMSEVIAFGNQNVTINLNIKKEPNEVWYYSTSGCFSKRYYDYTVTITAVGSKGRGWCGTGE